MNSFVYPKFLNKLGIERLIPNTNDQEKINEIIFKELVNGVFKEDSRLFFNEVINHFKQKGCNVITFWVNK